MKILYFLLLCFFLVFNIHAQECIISGNIKGIGKTLIVLNYTQKGVMHYDTIYSENDAFNYKITLKEKELVTIRFNYAWSTSFWFEPGKIFISGKVGDHYLLIGGTLENEILTNFRKNIEYKYSQLRIDKPDSLIKDIKKQEHQETLTFIRENIHSITSLYLLYGLLIHPLDDIVIYESIYKSLHYKESRYSKMVFDRLQILENQPIVGREVPSFILPDTSGRSISLNGFRGKFVLLDFWGHWCGPCLKAFPRLKKLQQLYKDKLIIIGIAAEYNEDKDKWLSAIKKADASWIQLSELMGDGGEVNTKYNIMSFPSYLLLDKNGILLERSETLEKIELKLSKENI